MNISSINNKAKTMRDDIAHDANSALQSGQRLLNEAKDKASETSDAALKEISALVSSLSDKVKQYGLDTDAVADKARAYASDIEKTLMSELRERPMRSLAIAGAIGLFLGFVSRR